MATDRGNARIFTVQGTADEPYVVVVAEDPEFSSCTCPSFFYRKGRSAGVTCKHLRDYVPSYFEVRPGTPAEFPGGIAEMLEEALTTGLNLGRRIGRQEAR